MDSVKINKQISIITNNSVVSFKKKSDFWKSDFVKNTKTFQVTSSVNNNSLIKKFKSFGFIVDVDNSWGFDWDVKLIVRKK